MNKGTLRAGTTVQNEIPEHRLAHPTSWHITITRERHVHLNHSQWVNKPKVVDEGHTEAQTQHADLK